jgi:histidyl-tRNA synthetase
MAAETSPFTAEEFSQWDAASSLFDTQSLKGKPSPEQQVKIAARAKATAEVCSTIRARFKADLAALGEPVTEDDKARARVLADLAGKNDKALGKALDAALESFKAGEREAFLSPPHGTRDWFPSEMRFRNYLFGAFRAVGVSHGFDEFDAPVLEHQRLFKRKAGEEIVDQMYAFTDKDGAEVTLRPEMTPSLARMVLRRQNAVSGEIKETLPLKWFCVAQCWRHETTQRGRKREHYQWNMDIVGHQGITAELELLSAVAAFFRRLGVGPSDVGIKINSRRVLNSICASYGVPADKFAAVCVVLDKLDKIGAPAVKAQLVASPLDVPSASADKMLQALAAPTVAAILEQLGAEATDELRAACDEMTQLFALAEAYGFADFLQFDASVVRGLAYYTGIVFECFDKKFGLRAICGGGRYDRLMSLYGSPVEVPCVGFGFGDCVIKELLQEMGLMPPVEPSVDFVVAAYNEEMYAPSLKVGSCVLVFCVGVRVCICVVFEGVWVCVCVCARARMWKRCMAVARGRVVGVVCMLRLDLPASLILA